MNNRGGGVQVWLVSTHHDTSEVKESGLVP